MIDFSAQIEEDLLWREAELASLKIQASQAADGSVKKSALLRAMWAMLYAHFEGFTKFSWDMYLDELTRRGVDRKKLKESICKLSLCKEFNGIKGNLSHDNIWDFCLLKFNELLEGQAKFDKKLETNSNLYPNIFEENAQKIDIYCQTLDENRTLIKTLVTRRNEIAHGQKMAIKTLGEYQKYEDAVLLVVHELGCALVEALDNKLYLKDPT